MYKRFFGLKVNPFNVNPDPRFLFLTQHTKEALACLSYGVQARKGFVLLTGEVGTGKTTLLNRLMDFLRQRNIKTAFVFNPRLETVDFLRYMMADFGIRCASPRKGDHLLQLNQWLLERYRAGEVAALIVDEAQNLSADLLEEVRLLTNLETATEKLLQIVLAGQPELELRLKDPHLRQLWQRITLRCRTHPFTLEETQQYIEQRLRLAAANGTVATVFLRPAVSAIYGYAQGIPRVINLLCEHALIDAFADQRKSVTAESIQAIAREFELDKITPTVSPEELGSGESLRLIGAVKNLGKLDENVAPVKASIVREKGEL